MLITILKGEVAEDKAHILTDSYKEALKKPEKGILSTYLTKDTKDPKIWQIITIWESKAALEKMRKLGTPKGILIFRSAGVEPTLSVYEVKTNS